MQEKQNSRGYPAFLGGMAVTLLLSLLVSGCLLALVRMESTIAPEDYVLFRMTAGEEQVNLVAFNQEYEWDLTQAEGWDLPLKQVEQLSPAGAGAFLGALDWLTGLAERGYRRILNGYSRHT